MEVFNKQPKKDHILFKIDVRVKLVISLIVLLMILSYEGFLFPLLILFASFTIYLKMRIPIRLLFIRFSEPVFIASVIIILKFIFSGQEPLFSIEILDITITGYKDSLMDGLQIGTRILGAVSVVIILSLTTPFIELIAALSWFKVPKGFIEILMFAYRYIFVLFEDASIIYNAQKNRLGYSSISRGLGSFGMLAGSLILKAFENSQNITASMVQRGYDGNIPILKQRPFRLSEVFVSLLFILAVGIIWKI